MEQGASKTFAAKNLLKQHRKASGGQEHRVEEELTVWSSPSRIGRFQCVHLAPLL